MVEIALPANSKCKRGGACRRRRMKAANAEDLSLNPDEANPRMDTYTIHADDWWADGTGCAHQGENEVDSTLTFRRSCREGICGSCAMNIDGQNTLACTKGLDDVKGDITIYPLPHMPVIKVWHLICQICTRNISRLNRGSKRTCPSRKANGSKAARTASSWTGCMSAFCVCCSTSCPSYWWDPDKYLGPAVLLQAYRWLADSRDEKPASGWMIWKTCSVSIATIMNCAKACLKGLSPAKAISEIKKMMVEREV